MSKKQGSGRRAHWLTPKVNGLGSSMQGHSLGHSPSGPERKPLSREELSLTSNLFSCNVLSALEQVQMDARSMCGVPDPHLFFSFLA